MWVTGTPEIGKPVRPSLLCEPGIAIIATALKTASIQLPFGLLQLDPATLLVLYQGPVSATRLLAPQLTIPNNPALHGARVPLQGLGPNNANGVSLSGLAVLNIR